MNFLKKLSRAFSGAPSNAQDIGYYYYFQCRRCGEVLRVRINPNNDLSANDDNTGYFVYKTLVGSRGCFNRIEVELYFDSNRKLTKQGILGGTQSDKAAFDAYEAAHPQQAS